MESLPLDRETAGASVAPAYIFEDFSAGRRLVGFGNSAFQVRIVPVQTARAIIEARHYSRRSVRNSYLNLGVFVAGELLGVLQIGWPINPKSSTRIIGVNDYRRLAELNRMWLDDACAPNSESRAISYALRVLARLRPHVVAVQSFADSRCGLNGVVYQAAGFRYFGQHATEFLEIDGEAYHPMLLSTLRTHPSVRGRFLRDNIGRAKRHSFAQHRYIYFMRRRFARLALLKEHPFPKVLRPVNGTSGIPSRQRGSIPCGRSMASIDAQGSDDGTA